MKILIFLLQISQEVVINPSLQKLSFGNFFGKDQNEIVYNLLFFGKIYYNEL